MKGKRLLILGAAFALGLSACASATRIIRTAPLNAAGDTPTGDWVAIESASEINTNDDFLLAFTSSSGTYYATGAVSSSALVVSNAFANAKTVRFETATNGYYIKISDSAYINNSSSTGISAGAKSSIWRINSSDLCVENTSNSNRFLGGASATGNIKAYASSNKASYPNVHVLKQSTGSEATITGVSASIKDGKYYAGSTLEASDFNVTVSWSDGNTTNPASGFTWTVNGVANGELSGGSNAIIVTYHGESSTSFNVTAITITAAPLSNYDSLVKGDKVDFYAYYLGRYSNNNKGYFVGDGNVGAYVYDTTPSDLNEGDILRVKGDVDVYNGLREIVNTTVTKVDNYQGLTEPATLALTENAINSLAPNDQGRKTTITGQVTAISTTPSYGSSGTSPLYTIKVSDSASLKIQLHRTNITESEYNNFVDKAQVGNVVTVVGFMGAYHNGVTDVSTLTVSDYQMVNPISISVEEGSEPELFIVSIDDALTAAQALTANTESFDWYQIQGYITETDGWNADFDNIDYILGDKANNPTNTITVYRSVAADGTTGADLKVGDKVTVVGHLKKYVNSNDVTTLEVTTGTTTLNEAAIVLSLDKSSLRLDLNESSQLNATIKPANASVAVTWLTSNNSVATVVNGLVTAGNTAGEATITAFVDLDEDGSLDNDEPSASCDVSVVNASAYIEALYKQALFGADNNQSLCNTYTTTWSSINNNFQVDVSNGSNNNNGWSGVIKFGRSAAASTGSITTNMVIDKMISKVVINFTDITAGSVNSIKLQTSSNGSEWTDVNSFTLAAGEQTVEVGSPAENLYYRIIMDLQKGSKNGFVALNSVSYYSIEEASSITPDHYFASATTVATIHGSESISDTNKTYSLVFENAGLANGERISHVGIGSAVLSGDKGSNSSYPTYYSDGADIRVYAGNTITLSSKATITSITFTFAGSASGFEDDADGLDGNVWTGEANTVVFTNTNGSGNLKITAIEVTTANSVEVSSAGIRFGATISQEDWNAIADNNWEIEDYGVMLVKKNTLTGYGFSSVEEAYRANNPEKPINILSKGSGDTPYPDGDNYLFTVKVNVKEASYGVVFCAAPFIVVDGEYYFLTETEFSVNTLAQHYLKSGGASLSNEALSMLSRNWED